MRNLCKSILIVVVAVFSLESVATAQILKNLLKQTTTAATASTPTAYSQGQTAGVALKSLYAQYKTDGKKLDMGNLSNILNVASLAGSVGELKTADASYKKEYAKGLVLGSLNLVTEPQSTSVISGLTSLANIDLTSLTKNEALQNAASEVIKEKASETISSLLSSNKVSETTEKANSIASQAVGTIENASQIASKVTDILSLFK